MTDNAKIKGNKLVDRISFTATDAVSLGVFDPQPKEMMCYLYLPIKLIDSNLLEIPPALNLYVNMVHAAMQDYRFNVQDSYKNDLFERYIYITAKTLFVTPDNIGNRPGYHCDGFGTDDINYIWCDKYPTVFCRGDFSVQNDDVLSLDDMNQQARPDQEYTLGEKVLARIDSRTMHRTPSITESGIRTFVKISISKHRYNLEGNSHNYGLSYSWPMFSRSELRNMENKDFHLGQS